MPEASLAVIVSVKGAPAVAVEGAVTTKWSMDPMEAVKVAVTVDAALTVIVVEAEAELVNVAEPDGEALQLEKV